MLLSAAVFATTPQPSSPAPDAQEWTLVIVHETYHGSSTYGIPHYPTRQACEKEVARVRWEAQQMQYEKETDFLYADAYCLRSYR
jgi:hypothetical protein